MKPKTRIARPGETNALVEVILSANPHLEDRVRKFLDSGAGWHKATPVVCEAGGRIVSCACVFHRQLWMGGQKLWFGGIGAVSTHPSERRKGYASLVMAECEEILRGQGYQAAVLFCEMVDFYRRLGWSTVEEDWVEFVLSGPTRDGETSSYRLRNLRASEVTPEIRKLSDESSEPAGSAVVRCDGVWSEYASWQREDFNLFWAAYQGHRPVAYVRGRQAGSGLRLLEATCREGHERAFLMLLEKQRQVAAGEAPVAFHAFLSLQHPLHAVLKSAGVQPDWRKTGADTGIMMIKALGGTRPPVKSPLPRGKRYVSETDFKERLPWWPRTWWAIDRF